MPKELHLSAHDTGLVATRGFLYKVSDREWDRDALDVPDKLLWSVSPKKPVRLWTERDANNFSWIFELTQSFPHRPE